jgi:hypothetical protein
VSKRRAFTLAVIERAKEAGEIRSDVDGPLLIDRIYGPIYYRLLLRHEPLDADFGKRLLDDVLSCVR